MSRRRTIHPTRLGAHALLLPAALVALTFALLGGLARIGATAAAPGATIAWHGALAVFGFLGVLVGIERAVALRARWAFVGPLLGVGGVLALLAGAAPTVAAASWTAGGAVAAATVWTLHRSRPAHALRVMLAACGCWMVGAALWGLGAPARLSLLWWAGFLVLMICGERIQFGKLARTRRSERWLLAILLLLGVGLVAALVGDPVVATRVAGVALVALAGWLFVVDVLPRAWRPGLLGYVSVGLVASYAWLAAAGGIWLAGAAALGGPIHDALVHALFQGFVLGMVLTHAPMIFPALTGLRMPFHPALYAVPAAFHAGLLARVVGDLVGAGELARGGAIGTAAALAAFVLAMAASAVAGRVSAGERILEPRRAAGHRPLPR